MRPKTLIPIAAALAGAVPAFALRAGALVLPNEAATLGYGLAILGAAFCLSWAVEAAERDIPRALALIAVALLAVLPEYAVDAVFAFKAGQDPAFAPYAAANMTGSNRLLLGLGWPAVLGAAWLARGRRRVRLDATDVTALAFLGLATAYSFLLPLKASISLADSAVLLGLFAVYAASAARAPTEAPALVGPAAAVGALPTVSRRLAVAGLLGFAGLAVGLAAEPFARGLVETGRALHVDEFLLVQWLAPLASEAPEFLVAILLATRGRAGAALGLLLSAKVNQWTVLVGSLPLAFSLGAGHPAALPLDARQQAEVLLTAAQSLFGLGVLAGFALDLRRSALLAGLFVVQLVSGGMLRAALHRPAAGEVELLAFAALYALLGVLYLFRARWTLWSALAAAWLSWVMRPKAPRPAAAPGEGSRVA